MDILAHGLWAGAAGVVLRRKTGIPAETIRGIVVLAVLPDFVQFGPLVAWLMSAQGSISALYEYAIATPGTEPLFPENVKALVYHLHCITHSAVVAGAVTLLIALVRRQWLIALLGWWSHIVIDVFTHSQEYYPTPVLYPFSYWGFDGVAWNTPAFMLVNYLLLSVTYAWLWSTRGRQRPPLQ